MPFMPRYRTYLISALTSVAPLCAHGQSLEYPKNLLEQTLNMLNMLLPILVVVATLFFVWACIQLIRAQKDEERTEGRKRALWGIIALFILVSIWGLVALLQGIFFGGNTSNDGFGVPDFIDEWDDDGGGGAQWTEPTGDGDNDGGSNYDGGDGGGPPGYNDMSDPRIENPLI